MGTRHYSQYGDVQHQLSSSAHQPIENPNSAKRQIPAHTFTFPRQFSFCIRLRLGSFSATWTQINTGKRGGSYPSRRRSRPIPQRKQPSQLETLLYLEVLGPEIASTNSGSMGSQSLLQHFSALRIRSTEIWSDIQLIVHCRSVGLGMAVREWRAAQTSHAADRAQIQHDSLCHSTQLAKCHSYYSSLNARSLSGRYAVPNRSWSFIFR